MLLTRWVSYQRLLGSGSTQPPASARQFFYRMMQQFNVIKPENGEKFVYLGYVYAIRVKCFLN